MIEAFIAPFFISLLISGISISLLLRFAHAYGIVDKPDAKLKQHKKPVAYLGGLAIYLGLLSSSLLFFSNTQIISLVFGLGLFLLLGLFDDLRPITPFQKFFAQFSIALYFVGMGFMLHEPFFPMLFNYTLSIFWILSVVNAFNLVDIMDGLSTTIAFGATLTFGICAILLNSIEIARFTLSMVGSIIPFLFINYPPARMYLGDAGSMMLGGFLAVIPFTLPWNEYVSYGHIAPPAILGIILLECLSLIIIRVYKGIPPYMGSRDHFAHYLLDNGWSKRMILWYVSALSLYIGLVVILVLTGSISFSVAALGALLFFIIWVFFLRKPINTLL